MTKLLRTGLLSMLALSLLCFQAQAEKVMTITATRTETLLKDAPGAVSVITEEQIAEQPVRDIIDILSETPGVSLLGQGVGGRKTISIRGADNHHTLVLVDGRRIAASDAVMGHSNFENSWVPIENIKRIEVVRGPLSSLYGSEALGGVVNIITKAPTEEWHGGFKIGGGTHEGKGGNSTNVGAHVSGPLLKDRLGLTLSLEHVQESAIPDEDSPLYSDIEGRTITSFSPKLVLTPNASHTFELYANLIDEERDFLSQSRNRDVDSLYELKKYMVGLSWDGEIGQTRSKINLYKSRIDKLSIKTYLDTNTVNESPDIATNEVLDAQTSFNLFGTMATLGGEYRIEGIEADSLSDIGGKEEITHKAVFLQDEIVLLNDCLRLTPGVRFDDHEFFGSETSPRLYVLFKLTDQINIKAGYGHAFNAPTAKQVSPGYNASSGPHDFLGNPNVKPEKSDSYEAGVEYFSDSITAKIFYFHNDIEDLIDYERIGNTGPGGRFGIYQASNIDEARLRGVELELTAKLPHNFDISTGYNYLDAEDTKNDEELTGRPEHTVNFKVAHTFDSLGLRSIVRYQYVGEQYFSSTDENEAVDAYNLWHFGLTKQLGHGLELQGGIENIGDVRLADKSDLYPYEERGRFIYANLKGRF